ncbi:MAG: hypothetical protein AABX70_04125 [Nanoarchaeota archaeon]
MPIFPDEEELRRRLAQEEEQLLREGDEAWRRIVTSTESGRLERVVQSTTLTEVLNETLGHEQQRFNRVVNFYTQRLGLIKDVAGLFLKGPVELVSGQKAILSGLRTWLTEAVDMLSRDATYLETCLETYRIPAQGPVEDPNILRGLEVRENLIELSVKTSEREHETYQRLCDCYNLLLKKISKQREAAQGILEKLSRAA